MSKQFTVITTPYNNGSYRRVLWEEELEERFSPKEVSKMFTLEIGETYETEDPFVRVERGIDG